MKVVFSTFPNEEKAKEVAKKLVEERLAACVWVMPQMTSFYIWEGKLEEDKESLLVAKTVDEKLDDLVKRLKELHPYEVPEIIALDTAYVLPEYQKWAEEVCGK